MKIKALLYLYAMPFYALVGGLVIAIIVFWLIAKPSKEDKQVFDQFDKDQAENQRIMRDYFSKPPVTNIYNITNTPHSKKHNINAEDIEEIK